MPVIDTVFSPSFGNRPSRLIGRDDVVRRLEDGLDALPGSRERATLILGQRGSGKTILLWELAERARAKGYVVADPTVCSEGMLDRIIEKLQRDGEDALPKRFPEVTSGSFSAFGFTVGLQFSPEVQDGKTFAYKIACLAEALGECGKGILVLVDEVQANNADVRALVAAYQEMVGRGLNVALCMAGLPASISSTLNDRVLTFLNRASKIVLGPVRTGDIDAFYAGAFDELRVSVDAETRAGLAGSAMGSPYLMQLIGHYAVVRAGNGGVLGGDDANEVIRSSVADYKSDVCQTTLNALSDKDVEFLTAMARDERDSAMSDVAARMGVTGDYAQKYRRRLIVAGVIQSKRRGYVSFAVPYLAEHLRVAE